MDKSPFNMFNMFFPRFNMFVNMFSMCIAICFVKNIRSKFYKNLRVAHKTVKMVYTYNIGEIKTSDLKK